MSANIFSVFCGFEYAVFFLQLIFLFRMLGMSLSFYMPSYFGINYDALFARHTSYNNSDNSDVKKALQ